MQEKPPFSSYFDFFSLTYGRGTLPPPYFDFALRHAPESPGLQITGGGYSDIFIYIGPKYFMYT